MPVSNFPAHQDERVKVSFIDYSRHAQEQSAYNMLFNVGNSNDYARGFSTIEGGDLPTYFDEQENLKENSLNEGYQTTGTSREFGHKIIITKKEKLQSKDETTLVNKVVNEKVPYLVGKMNSFIEKEAHTLFNDGFAGATHLAPDGAAIFGTHTWKSTGTTFVNRHASNIVAGSTALDALEAYGGAFVDAYGDVMPLTFRTLVVKTGSSAAKAFKQTLEANNGVTLSMVATTVANVNIYKGGQYTLVETPYITSDTAWFAHANNVENSFILDFIQTPMLEDRIMRENLDEVFPCSASFRYGNYKLPTDWYGSDGTGS